MLVALAKTAAKAAPRRGVSAAISAGKVSSVPPPAMALTAPASSAVRHSHNRLRSAIGHGVAMA